MSCPKCNQTLLNGIYYCDINDYRIIDNITDKNLIFIFKTHDIEQLYVDDFYGGHLSHFGNEIVARTLYSNLMLK